MKKLLLTVFLLPISLLASEISTYLKANYIKAPALETALKAEGFEVLGAYDAMGDSKHHIIVITNADLKKAASEEKRGFAGVLKVLVDAEKNTLVVTNPEYFMHAFLQDDYKEDKAKSITSSLSKAMGSFTNSKLSLDDDDLEGYHYMFGMPYYEDMVEVAEGEHLAQKLEKNAGANLVFKLDLGKSVVYGIAMPIEKEYIAAIEAQDHAAFLPYMVMIEDGEAKILHGKYYLAISNPGLSMGAFMKISSTPGEIEDFMTALFK